MSCWVRQDTWRWLKGSSEKLPNLKAHRILHGLHPRDNGSQHKHLCSIFHLPSLFAHSKPVSIVASHSPSIKTQQSAFHISQTWVHKPPLPPSTLFSPLKNKDTSRQSRCIKSICRLNLLQGEVQIRPASRDRFLLPCSKTCPVCLLSSTARVARWAKLCDSTGKKQPTDPANQKKKEKKFHFFHSWSVFTYMYLVIHATL